MRRLEALKLPVAPLRFGEGADKEALARPLGDAATVAWCVSVSRRRRFMQGEG
jgi:hypothetical protein